MIYFSKKNLCSTILLLELVKIVHSSPLSSVTMTKLLSVGVAAEETIPFDNDFTIERNSVSQKTALKQE